MFGSSRIKLVVSYGYSITQWRIVELDKNIHGFSSSRVRYVYYYTQIRRGGGGEGGKKMIILIGIQIPILLNTTH